MGTYDHIKCTTCGVPHGAYHQVESALLRAVELLEDIRAPVPVPTGRVDEVRAQARAALRLDVPASAGGARAAVPKGDGGGMEAENRRLRDIVITAVGYLEGLRAAADFDATLRIPARDTLELIVRDGQAALAGSPAPIPAAPPESPPAPTVHEGQALLVAVGRLGPDAVLGAEGDFVAELLDDADGVLRDLDGLDDGALPTAAGLHVWEGSIAEIPVGNSDGDFEGYEYEWSGAWRPARAGDLARFGLGETRKETQ